MFSIATSSVMSSNQSFLRTLIHLSRILEEILQSYKHTNVVTIPKYTNSFYLSCLEMYYTITYWRIGKLDEMVRVRAPGVPAY